MSFRSRILAVSTLVTLLPLAVLTLAVRGEVARQLTGQYDRRVAALLSRVQSDLTARGDEIALRLDALDTRLTDDNRFRLAAVARVERERLYLLDYAVKVMGLMGLSMLQIQDADARILSSGHFRNEYGTLDPGLPALLRQVPGGVVLAMARRPAGPFLALVRGMRFEVGGRAFTVIGGVEVRRDFLTSLVKDKDLVLSLVYPGGALSTDAAVQDRLAAEVARSESAGGAEPSVWRKVLPASEHVVRTAALPFTAAAVGDVDAPAASTATILVSYPRAPLTSMLHRLDLYLAAVLAASAVGSLLLAMWFSAAVSRPIARLARRTAAIDLDHLDADFSTTRRDEVGMLSRFLAVMLDRLRSSSQALRDAERRATRGEIARQVNHDLCNGLTPIRNVVNHLTQVARDEPAQLARVLRERHRTLEASISYLDGLADNYRRISGREARSACDLNEVVRQAVTSMAETPGVELRLRLDPDLPRVLAGEVSLRRIVENLVRNACEAVGEAGTVTVTTGTVSGEAGRPGALLAVADTGPGVPEDLRHRIFDEFFSTKPSGDGLGLAIVRRLVRDAGGSIELEGESRDGARFTVLLPVAGAQS